MYKTRTYFLIIITLFVSFISFDQNVHANSMNKAILAIRSSDDSEMETQLMIMNNKTIDDIAQTEVRKPVQAIPVSDTYLTLINNNANSTFMVDRKGNLFDEKTDEMIEINERIKTELVRYIEHLRLKHFGKMIEWEKASDLIRRKLHLKSSIWKQGLCLTCKEEPVRITLMYSP
ncbi:hypothetical protein [Paenibacillus agricola]|uniref:Uncharacterized protein n=1 Tax=Paenibacillus agricola TaxID=2716264 RepID=A0ABX0JEP3_9BACL|nr:hypothetical protein [Paenibacillus agricola]NHN35017.1 hypothetical protein [Paenibacillus agricola]